MIILDNVTKIYKSKHYNNTVLSDVSVIIPSGFNVGILGRNGAGKSTLLRLLGGIELPTFGKIFIPENISWPVGLGSGQRSMLSAKQNILFVCQVYGKNKHEIIEIIKFIREFCDIGKHFDQPIKTYSSGMRARFNFALSVAFKFNYYLIDEVTGVGDPTFKKKSEKVFENIRKNSTLMIVSHDMQTIRNCSDICILVNNKKIEVFDDVEYAINKYSKL